MELSRTLMLIVGIIICLVAPRGSCIKCYQCNSEYDPRCADPFDSYSIGEVDCNLKPKLDHLNQFNATLCRKISQKVNGKLRTIRSCGYLPAENDQLNCVHRSGTYEVHVQYCACKGDLCNTANTRNISLLPLLIFFARIIHQVL